MPCVSSRPASNPRRAIPAVEHLLREPDAEPLLRRWRRERVVEAVRDVLAEVRTALADGTPVPDAPAILGRVLGRLEERAAPRMGRVINATGVVLHTNLGRASLAEAAVEALVIAARGAVNLEVDLPSGRRGNRDDLVATDLCALTGAEAALVVNNCAAAVLLVVNSLALGREVVVSRGELVEIGGSFRMPEVMARSGARLREVGTTNRTHPDDYRAALGPDTALLMKVHTSNYRVVGFTAAVDLGALVAIGREAGVPVVEDLGAGALVDLSQWGLPREPVVGERVAAGADLVTFSGDKLLGGPAGRDRRRPSRPDRAAGGESDAARAPTRQADARGARRDAAALPRGPGPSGGATHAPLARAADGRDGRRRRCRGAAARGAPGRRLPRHARRERRRGRQRIRPDGAAREPGAGGGAPDGLRRRHRHAASGAGVRPSSVGSATTACCSICAASCGRRTWTSTSTDAVRPRHRRPHRPRQDRARARAHRAGHRPPEGGEGAWHLDRPRLRVPRPSGRRAGRRRRRARSRALHPQHARRRARHRLRAASRSPPTTASCRRPRSTSTSCTCSAYAVASSRSRRSIWSTPRASPRCARRSRSSLLDTTLEGAPILPVSTVTGTGLDALRAAIATPAGGARRSCGSRAVPAPRRPRLRHPWARRGGDRHRRCRCGGGRATRCASCPDARPRASGASRCTGSGPPARREGSGSRSTWRASSAAISAVATSSVIPASSGRPGGSTPGSRCGPARTTRSRATAACGSTSAPPRCWAGW